MPIPYDLSALLTVTIISLMVAAYLADFIPRCGHPECQKAYRDAHADAQKRDRARQSELAIVQTHAFHDRFRPQANCPLCKRSEP